MKISINWDNTKFTLRLPTSLALNRCTAGMVRKELEKEGIHLTHKQTVLLIKELKRYKKTHRDWNLVEITENDKNSIIIKI